MKLEEQLKETGFTGAGVQYFNGTNETRLIVARIQRRDGQVTFVSDKKITSRDHGPWEADNDLRVICPADTELYEMGDDRYYVELDRHHRLTIYPVGDPELARFMTPPVEHRPTRRPVLTMSR